MNNNKFGKRKWKWKEREKKVEDEANKQNNFSHDIFFSSFLFHSYKIQFKCFNLNSNGCGVGSDRLEILEEQELGHQKQ